MNLIEEYKNEWNRYFAFSKAISKILKTYLKDNKIRFQAVTYRAKTPESLEKKLTKREHKSLKGLDELADLAGCRVIFYLESDATRFKNTIYEIFGRDNISYHPKYSKDSYNADHFRIKLSKERTALVEYANFEGLKCEIQVTNVLYHAWSELNHDVFYKFEDGIKHFDSDEFNQLNERFNRVMQESIKKAMHDFEFIYKDFIKLENAFKFYNAENLNNARSTSNGTLSDFLKKLLECLINFGEKCTNGLTSIDLVKQCIYSARNNSYEAIRFGDQEFPGKTYEDIILESSKVYKAFAFVYPDEVLSFIREFNNLFKEENNNCIKELVDKLFEPEIRIIENSGYVLQWYLSWEIVWDDELYLKNRSLFFYCVKKLLSLDFSNSYSQGRSINIVSGTFLYHISLEELRLQIIDHLMDMYSNSSHHVEKAEILRILERSSHFYPRGKVDPNLMKMLEREQNYLFDFSLYFYKDSSPVLRNELDLLCKSVFKAIPVRGREFYALLKESQPEYELRKLIFNSGNEWFYGTKYETQVQKVNDWILTKSPNEVNRIVHFVVQVLHEYENIRDTLKFGLFIKGAVQACPEIGFTLLNNHFELSQNVLEQIILGIYSNDPELSSILIYDLIEYKYDITRLAWLINVIDRVDLENIESCYNSLKDQSFPPGTFHFLQKLVSSIKGQHPENQKIKKIFLEVFSLLTEEEIDVDIRHCLCSWSDVVGTEFDDEMLDAVMEYIVTLKDIGNLEYDLANISKKRPDNVLRMLKLRLESKISQSKSNYYVVPFSLHYLDKEFANNAHALNEFFELYREFVPNNRRHVVSLVESLFDVNEKYIEDKLLKIMDTEDGAAFVYDILRDKFDSISLVSPLFAKLVQRLPLDDETFDKLYFLMHQSGVLHGEEGQLHAFEDKVESLKILLNNNEDPKIKAFANKAIEIFEKEIAVESRDVEFQLAAKDRNRFVD